MHRPRILEVVADGQVGGGTTHVLRLAAAVAADLPAEVHLVSQAGSEAISEGLELGLEVHGLDFWRSRLDPRLWLRLRALVHRLRPALIHAHGARAALPLTHLAHVAPLLYTVHGYHFTGKSGLTRRLALMAERRCSRAARTTIFVSAHDLETAGAAGIFVDREHKPRGRGPRPQEPGPRHRIVIPNGVDIPDERPGERPDEPADPYRIGFLGRLVEQKNPLLLPEIVARLEPPHHLVVVGDGELRPALEARAGDLGVQARMVMRGSLPHAAALAELARFGVLVLPSHWEGLPLAVLEAMAHGVPVVASAVGGTPEVIEHGESGFLCPPDDPTAFAGAIRMLTSDPVRRREIRARGRARIASGFTEAAAHGRHLDLYRQVLECRHGGGVV